MKIAASKLRCGDVIKTSPPLRIEVIKREGLRVTVRDGLGRERTYLMAESLGVVRDEGADR